MKEKAEGMNILILSVGTRNKIVRYFKKELNGTGKVIATDMSNLAPAIYEADKYFIVPKITDKNYIEIILDICRKENVDGVLSLIDPELSLLAQNVLKFGEIGVEVIGSPFKLCELALNKWDMYRWLEANGYKCAKSYIDIMDFQNDYMAEKIDFPVIVKPACGSASIAVQKIDSMELLAEIWKKSNDLMIQEFLSGQEIGADIYIDAVSGETVSIFTKKKLLMRAGETDKAVSFKDEKLFALIKDFASKSGFKWQIDMDLFDVDGEYYISEINPRFGGGYPHAYECGCNHVRYIINNLAGKKNNDSIGKYEEEVYMAKYNEVLIKKF